LVDGAYGAITVQIVSIIEEWIGFTVEVRRKNALVNAANRGIACYVVARVVICIDNVAHTA
jgi:hypothetical protein